MSLSSSFRGLSYQDAAEETGVLARFYPGWTRADLMGMSVRERRYRLAWAEWARAQARNGR